LTIVSIKSGTGSEIKRIELSDGSFFSFKTCYLSPVFLDESLYSPGMAEGREISAAEEAGFRFASACLRAEKAALRLIARAEQCRFGLVRKLERRGHEPACVNAALSRLVELELVDDRRFARLWLQSHLRPARSPRRLLSSLCGRGIAQGDARAALKTVLDAETEWALLRRFAEKHAYLPKSGEEANSQTLKHVLKSEGFSTQTIQRFFEAE
jgi:regulatory protein